MEKHPDPRGSSVGLGTGDSPESWARRLRRGDALAVQEARQRVSRILVHGALSIPPQERQDLEQEIMTEIWQAVNRPHFDFSAGFWGFVEVVASRRSIDWLRSRRESVGIPETVRSTRPGPLGLTLERERRARVEEVLADLDPLCREVLLARFRDDLSYEEIARRTGKTRGALRVQTYRCIRRARTLLENVRESR